MVESTVRLYLEKGINGDIFVDTIALPLHQNDAIRFLYRQFKQGAGGVVLNDPPGSGKRVAAVLFLEAVRPMMPTVVLCAEGKEQQWVQLFQNWTKMGSDVCIQRSACAMESVRPRCVVSAFTNWGALSRREWGALVVDDRAASREALRAALRANYKIWITSLDMKKNLQTFSLIYKYLNPGKRFIVEDYEANKKSPSVVLASSAKLDAFMEDIVLRRRGVSVPLANTRETICHATEKNKDPTGKKTKRSKPKPADEQDEHPDHQETCSRSQQEDVPLSKKGKIMRNNSIEDFIVNVKSAVQTLEDVDAIDNEFPTSEIIQKRKKYGDYINNTEQKSACKVKNQNKLSKYTVDEVKTDDISLNKNELKYKNDGDYYINNSDSKVKNPNKLSIHTVEVKTDDISLDKNDLKLKNDGDDYINNSDSKVKNPNKLSIHTVDEVKTDDISLDKNDFTLKNDGDDYINNSDSKVKNPNKLSIQTVDEVKKDDISIDKNDLKLKNDGDDYINNSESKVKNPNIVNIHTVDEVKTDDISHTKNELVYKSTVNKDEKTLDGIELKMKQMEELAMKKFKGTFLDNII